MSTQRNRRQRQNQDNSSTINTNGNQENQAYRQAQTQNNLEMKKGNEEKKQREIIKVHFTEADSDLFKDITYYEFLNKLEVDQMCLKLHEILSIENSLPELNQNNEDFIIFLKFIQKLIQSINVLKDKQDLESSQKQMRLLSDTALGFLSLKDLENSILKRLSQKSGKALKNKKILLNNEQWAEFKKILDDIVDFVKNLENSIFSQIRQFYKLPPVLSFQMIEGLLESDDLNEVFQTLNQIYNQITNLSLESNKQAITLFEFISFLIMNAKRAEENEYVIYYKCIIKCLSKQQLINRASNWDQQNFSQEQKQKLIKSLQDIVKYRSEIKDSQLINPYKLALFDIYENYNGQDDDSSQQIDSSEKQEEQEFDEELMEQIAQELDLVQRFPNYKKEINLDTNILPNDSDCRNVKNYRGFLEKIQLKQKYKNQLDYLQNMFNFLRADSHQELVIGMNSAMQVGIQMKVENMQTFESKQQELNPLKVFSSQFNFYNNLEIISIQFQKGITLTLQIMPILPKKSIKLSLESSKRLIGGQYLYFTDYNFQKIYVCELLNEFVHEDIKNLDKQHNILRIKIKILDESQQAGFTIQNIQDIITQHRGLLIEPKEYYGQYISCMSAIKNMITDKYKLPFQDNLIQLQKKVGMPAFINEDTQYYLDFTPLNEIQQDEYQDDEEYVQTNNNQKNLYQQRLVDEWKDIPTQKYLNESQVKAVKNILTKEISIIQGPPGTGKTYVGAIAIKNLLQNSEVWNPNKNVILMCCKTNHALDQFLSHILKFERDVVRVGARTKLVEIKQFELKKLKSDYVIQKSSFFKSAKIEEKLNESLKYFSDKLFEIEGCEQLIKMLPEDIVKSCCKTFLLQFCSVLPFIAFSIDQILEDQEFYNIITVFWWQFSPDILQIRDKLFYPLIQKYEMEANQETSMYKIRMFLPSFSNFIQDQIKMLYMEKHISKQQLTNYFYQISSDDQVDEKLNSQQQSNFSYLWVKILSSRNNQNMKEYFKNDEEVDEQEYAEDRENYEVYEDQEMDAELDFEDYDENKKKKKKKQQKNLKNKVEFYSTYFQFFTNDLERAYEQIELNLRSEYLQPLDIYQQIYLRLKAISKFSQQTKQNLFSQKDMQEYEDQMQKLREEEIYADIQIMKKKKIVAMTLGGICKYSEYLKYLKYDVLLIEEAAEVLENLSVPLLQPFLKQIILIGDHQQLKPSVYSYMMEQQYNMNVSLFQRLVANEIEYECLNEQMRMCPEFSDYVRLIYKKPNQYLDNERVIQYERQVRGLPSNIMFLMHSYNELYLNYTTTKKNEGEAKLAIDLAQYILKNRQYTSDQITILSMYLGQAVMIKKLLRNEDLANIRVSTIDNYQGEENEIIILSLVRSSAKELGFVKISNRINVSISRAKKGFIILGNKNLLQTQRYLWSQIFNKARINNHIFEDKFSVKCPQHQKTLSYSDHDSFSKTPDGGCQEKCKQQNLSCKHICKYYCHGGSCDEYLCQEPVEVVFEQCLHQNKIECGLQNKKHLWVCKQKIKYINPKCKHEMLIECFKYDYAFQKIKDNYENELYQKENQCYSECGYKLQCGHKCKQQCHFLKQEFCDPLQCKEKINKQLACGHQYSGYCGDLPKHVCKVKVQKKVLPCGHVANNVICSFVSKCELECVKPLECGHRCIQKYCWQPHNCGQQSKRQLICGHVIIDQCQKDLSNYECNQISNKPLDCGHGLNTNACCEAKQFKCEQPVTLELDCSHFVISKCYQSKQKGKIKCEYPCTKKLDCGHNCQNLCGQECTQECMTNVINAKRDDCEHLFTGQCYKINEPCRKDKMFLGKQIKCYEYQNLNVTCNKQLSCGHRCKQKTFDKCICKEKIDLKCCNKQIYCFETKNHNCDEDNFI
ncbi:hypothetical protein ABPG72_020802 [Tetrahymena utriculariae]